MNKKLKQAQKEFQTLAKEHNGFNKKAMPEVVSLNKLYRETYPDKYPYNADILNFILEKENIDEDMHDYLNTEVYLSQQVIKEEREAEQTKEMAQKGFTRITKENILNIPIDVRVELSLNRGDMFSVRNVKKYKVVKADGEPFFLFPRAKRRGYRAFTLATGEYPAYYKLVS